VKYFRNRFKAKARRSFQFSKR
jgi:hypothetical protein